jgi:hypothetical protein
MCDQLVHQHFYEGLYVKQSHLAGHARLEQPTQKQLNASSEPDAASDQQQQQPLVPCSYIVGLLRRDLQQEIQQVLRMTPQDWLDHFAGLMPQIVLLLELCHRADQHSPQLQAATPSGSGLQESCPAGQAHPAHGCRDQPPASAGAGPLASMYHPALAAAGHLPSLDQHVQSSSRNGRALAVSTGDNLLGAWFGQHPPLGQAPLSDYQQLQEVMDNVAIKVMLGYVFNHVPILQACTSSYSPGLQVQPTQQHWEMVADKLHLTELQELHMCICLAE